MKIPFIKYIESLLICKQPIIEVFEKINKLNVPLCDRFTAESASLIYNKLKITNISYFEKNELPDPNWLGELEIKKMVAHFLNLEIPEGTFGITGSFEILNDPDMYKTITALALAKINEEDIELIVNGKYNIHYESNDILEFLHYFFNVKDWTLSDKKEYVSYIEDVATRKLYQLALDGDKDYLIWKLGLAPDKSFDQMLRDMMADSYYNFKEKMKMDPDMSQKWANLALRITDRVNKIEDESKEKKNLFNEIQFVIGNGNSTTSEGNGGIENNQSLTISIPHISKLRPHSDELEKEED